MVATLGALWVISIVVPYTLARVGRSERAVASSCDPLYVLSDRAHFPTSEDFDAGGTKTIEYYIVILKKKAGGRQRLHVLRTALDCVDLPACTALEMMIMGLRGSLIAGRLTGELNLDKPPFFNESFEGALDYRNPQTRSVSLRDLEHLFGPTAPQHRAGATRSARRLAPPQRLPPGGPCRLRLLAWSWNACGPPWNTPW